MKGVSSGGLSLGGSGDSISFVQGVAGSLTHHTEGELILPVHAAVVQLCLD